MPQFHSDTHHHCHNDHMFTAMGSTEDMVYSSTLTTGGNQEAVTGIITRLQITVLTVKCISCNT